LGRFSSSRMAFKACVQAALSFGQYDFSADSWSPAVSLASDDSAPAIIIDSRQYTFGIDM
jgi:hypothetical protein